MRSQRLDSGLSIKITNAVRRERPDKRKLELVLFDYNQSEFGLRKVSSLPNTSFLKAPLTVVPHDIGKRTVMALIIAELYGFIMKVAEQGKLLSHTICVMHNVVADSILRKPRWKKRRISHHHSPIFAARESYLPLPHGRIIFSTQAMARNSARPTFSGALDDQECFPEHDRIYARSSCCRLMMMQAESFVTQNREYRNL